MPTAVPPTRQQPEGAHRAGRRRTTGVPETPASPLIRAGRYAWALIGVVLTLGLAGFVVLHLTIVVVPLLLALFPAAILMPVVRWLRDRRLPSGLAAGLTMLVALALFAGLVFFTVERIQGQGALLVDQLQAGYSQLRDRLREGAFGMPALDVEQLAAQARQTLVRSVGSGQALQALTATVEGLAMLFVGIFALFFYLRDGARIAGWLRDLFPVRLRGDVEEVGTRVWTTLGGYIRGQAVVALVDAVLIGIGLVVLKVPLAGVLATLVFIGGFVPIIGAFVSGAAAVLVALAANGLTTALILFGIILAVQQLEGHVLAPVLLGRSVQLHPLTVVVALTAGGTLFGIVGAILAVPVTASVVRAVAYLRQRPPSPA